MEKSLEPMVLVSQAAQESNQSGNGTAAAGVCCYSGPTDCDGKRDYCSKDEANCAKCGGKYVVPESSSQTASGKESMEKSLEPTCWFPGCPRVQSVGKRDPAAGVCCYSGPRTATGSVIIAARTRPIVPSVVVSMSSPRAPARRRLGKSPWRSPWSPRCWFLRLPTKPNQSGNGTAAAGVCCYSGPTDCDGKRDYCSKDEANCAKCGGKYVVPESSSQTASGKESMEKSLEPMVLVSQAAHEPNQSGNGTAAAGVCCYSGPTDCDGKRDYPKQERGELRGVRRPLCRHRELRPGSSDGGLRCFQGQGHVPRCPPSAGQSLARLPPRRRSRVRGSCARARLGGAQARQSQGKHAR
ncbi:unnamed protein product [Prorocentrum cordatum]|uniref:Uncharacterized protein n=1 Tax=Prorocentrum cordatum TaxID=2364126 RepID=A0ABN9WPX2_9DINO|nr:unnamed protein product [Polarella glacialis]